MDATEAARRAAEHIHLVAVAMGDDPATPLAFVLREAARRDFEVYALQPGDSQLKRGRAVLDSQAGFILYEDAGSAFDRAFLVGHELGHVILEGGKQDVVTEEVEHDRTAEEAPVGIDRVVDYGARERREVRMDLFARELLLPRSVVRQLHVEQGLSSVDIAQHFGAPLAVVQQQLLDALLLPVLGLAGAPETAPALTPDPTQQTASNHSGSPFLLQAGPGTGKTRTLVMRIERLLDDAVDPTSILVLTFSNKAAQELSERLAADNPTASAAMWIGTFHAFGLDIVRRFHDKLGLPPDPRLIDRAEAIELLEDELPRLSLRHYRNLWDPVLDLSDMLSAISRAKDEVVDAAGYRQLAQAMAEAAGSDEEATRAHKCLEVALLYETYERVMTSGRMIDFGDLVALPVRLVESDAEVMQALQARHLHILVDEYQDVNRASVRLLKAIAGDGRNLWVVGDTRQSIYRFRGASSINMARFATDFPGGKANNQLGVNYRSVQEVIDVFTTFSTTMRSSAAALPLHVRAQRGSSGIPAEFRVVVTAEDEISGLAAAIQAQREEGASYRSQAVLCVSNARLSEIADGLEARGIPVLHLGNLFERAEIKDLLSLLSMLSDPYAAGLARAGSMAGHEVSLQDVANIVAALRETKAAALHWRYAGTRLPGLPADSRAALERLAALFEGVDPVANPWPMLASWVIDGLGLAKALHLEGGPRAQMKGLALWQFLNFCRRQPAGAGLPSVRLLDRIRRLVLLSEDRGLRQLPAVAEGIDAVRLMTIHGSKGLEFNTVHLPGLVTSGLPRNNMPPRCVPPDGLISGSAGLTGLEAVKAGHDEEEECLFFVALSRAQNRLFLYASSVQAGGSKRSQSKFIPTINHLLTRPAPVPQLDGATAPVASLKITWAEKPVWTDSQIGQFDRCPRRFLYTHLLKLGGRRTETAFMKMHNVVSDVFDWLKIDHETTTPSDSEIADRFEQAWRAKGATDHGYAADYQRIGRRLVEFLVETRNQGIRTPATPISLGWAEGDILVKADSVATGVQGHVVVRRVKTGKQRSNGFDDIEYTVLHMAVAQAYGPQAQVEVTFLTSEVTEPMTITAKKLEARREKLQYMLKAINAGRFPLKPEARTCPRCPHFFICGRLPAGAINVKNV